MGHRERPRQEPTGSFPGTHSERPSRFTPSPLSPFRPVWATSWGLWAASWGLLGCVLQLLAGVLMHLGCVMRPLGCVLKPLGAVLRPLGDSCGFWAAS